MSAGQQISQIREMPEGAAEIVTTLIPVAKEKDVVDRFKDREGTDDKVLLGGREGGSLSWMVQARASETLDWIESPMLLVETVSSRQWLVVLRFASIHSLEWGVFLLCWFDDIFRLAFVKQCSCRFWR